MSADEPTMGQWDDFCAVYPVPFDKFIEAYKAMGGVPVKSSIDPGALSAETPAQFVENLARVTAPNLLVSVLKGELLIALESAIALGERVKELAGQVSALRESVAWAQKSTAQAADGALLVAANAVHALHCGNNKDYLAGVTAAECAIRALAAGKGDERENT